MQQTRGGKDGFKALVFYGFLKNQKSRKVGFFCFLMVFLDSVVFV